MVNPRGGLPAWVVRVVGWVLMIAMVSAGGGLKVVRVWLVLGGGVASLGLVGGVGGRSVMMCGDDGGNVVLLKKWVQKWF